MIKNVGLDLPSFFDGFLGSNRQASSASGSLVVLECSLQDESHGGGLSKSLQMALIMISVPFVFLAFAPLVWLAFYKLQQYYNKKVTLAKVSSVKSEDTIEGIPSGKVEPFLSDHQDRFSSTPLIWGKEDSDVKIRFYLRKRMIITFIVVLFVM